jgi:hypothetical protein
MITVGEGFLTYAELAQRLLVRPQTIYNRMSRHKLPHTMIEVGSRVGRRGHRRIAMVPPESAAELARLLGRSALVRVSRS